MQLFNVFFAFLLAPTLVFANGQLIAGCHIPISQSARIAFQEILTQAPELATFLPANSTQAPTPAVIPIIAVKASETAVGVSNALGVMTLIPQTQISQGTRSIVTGRLITCQSESSDGEPEAPSWSESPTQLRLGNSSVSYDAGTVVGNWALFAGVSAAWAGAAHYFGAEKVRFSGGLSIPTFFLITPTTSAAVNLVRGGDAEQIALGVCSLVAQTVGSAAVGALTHPRFFKSTWNDIIEPYEWIDQPGNEGFTKRNNGWFDEYQGHRQGFVLMELGMSTLMGVLDSLKATKSHCLIPLTVAATSNAAYAISVLVLRPHQEANMRYFYAGVAGIQATALATQAIATAFASEETSEQIRPWTEGVVLACDWVLTIKSLYDIGRRLHTLYGKARDYFSSKTGLTTASFPINVDSWQEPLLSDKQSEIDLDEVQRVLNAAPVQEMAELTNTPPTDRTSVHSLGTRSTNSIDKELVEFFTELAAPVVETRPASMPSTVAPSSSPASTPKDLSIGLDKKVGEAHRAGGFNPFGD